MLFKIKQFLGLLSVICIAAESDFDESIEITTTIKQKKTEIVEELDINDISRVSTLVYDNIEEQIKEEMILGEMEMLAQLTESEAGNQDLTGKRYVVDVVLNRVDSDKFPNTIEEVIYQTNQFSVIKNGGFDKAAWHISEESYQAVLLEYKDRLNNDILYFSRGKSPYATKHFKHQDHWFGW